MKRLGLIIVITGILNLIILIPFATCESLIIKYFKNPESICFQDSEGNIAMEYISEDQEFVPFKEIFFSYSHSTPSTKIQEDETVIVSYSYYPRDPGIRFQNLITQKVFAVYCDNPVFSELRFIWKEFCLLQKEMTP